MIAEKIAAARDRLAAARQAEQAEIDREQAARQAELAAEAAAKADTDQKWAEYRVAIEREAAEVAQLEAQIEADRVQAIWDSVQQSEAYGSLWTRAGEALVRVESAAEVTGLPIGLLGQILLEQLAGVSVDAELWQSGTGGLTATVEVGGLTFMVARTDAASTAVIGSASLYVQAADFSWREIFTLADLGKVAREAGVHDAVAPVQPEMTAAVADEPEAAEPVADAPEAADPVRRARWGRRA